MSRSEHFAEGAQQHYRDATAVHVSHYGIEHVPAAEAPATYLAHHAMLGPELDKHGTQWQGAKVETIPADVSVRTTQPYLGREHVERYAARLKPGIARPVDFGPSDTEGRGQANGRPRVMKIGGEYWGVDGHHRLAAARSKGRAVKARVYDVDEARSRQIGAGPVPTTRYDVVNHLSEGHIPDNDYITSDHHDPNHGVEYGEEPWTDANLHEYHRELHATGVADHRHA